MEFFTFCNVIYEIVSSFPVIDPNDIEGGLWRVAYWQFGAASALFLLCLVLGGFGLYKMAKRRNIPHAWMGFLPFANTWLAGKLAGEANFFGQKMKRAGLYAMIAEIVYCAITALGLATNVILIPYNSVQTMSYADGSTYQIVRVDSSRVPTGLRWMCDGELYVTIFSYVAELVMIVFFCVLFVAFFRKYYARGPILMTFLSVLFPFRGIVIFAVRNNAPVDYNEFMRRRMEQYARQQQQYYASQSGQTPPAGGDDPFSDAGRGGSSGGSSGGGSEPFSDFGSGGSGSSEGGSTQNDDPFSDF